VQPLPIIPLLFIYQPKTIDNAIALPGDVFPLIDVSNALPDLAAIASVASDAVPVRLPVTSPTKLVDVVTPVTTTPRENPAECMSSTPVVIYQSNNKSPRGKSTQTTCIILIYNVIYL
jgi:hypothetical protein